MSKLTPEERKAIIERRIGIASLIAQICEAQEIPSPGNMTRLFTNEPT
jgi:hypothetical protein